MRRGRVDEALVVKGAYFGNAPLLICGELVAAAPRETFFTKQVVVKGPCRVRATSRSARARARRRTWDWRTASSPVRAASASTRLRRYPSNAASSSTAMRTASSRAGRWTCGERRCATVRMSASTRRSRTARRASRNQPWRPAGSPSAARWSSRRAPCVVVRRSVHTHGCASKPVLPGVMDASLCDLQEEASHQLRELSCRRRRHEPPQGNCFEDAKSARRAAIFAMRKGDRASSIKNARGAARLLQRCRCAGVAGVAGVSHLHASATRRGCAVDGPRACDDVFADDGA